MRDFSISTACECQSFGKDGLLMSDHLEPQTWDARYITVYNHEAEMEASDGHISSRLRFWIVDFSRTNLADYVYVAF